MMNLIANRRLRRGTGWAFTLVELLVVVSIIALLIAILLPSLKKARESSKRLACNANLRGLAQAGLTYASDDSSEFAIPIGPGDVAATNSTRTSFFGFGGKSGTGTDGNPKLTGSAWSGGNGMNAAKRPLNTVLYPKGISTPSGSVYNIDWSADARLQLDLYSCPGDKTFTGCHWNGWKKIGNSAYDHFGTSYAASPGWVGVPGEPEVFSNSIYGRPVSRVPNPGNTILYWEASAMYALYAPNPTEYDQTGCYWDNHTYAIVKQGQMVAKGFHGQDWRFNVSFGDGHAAWVKIRGHGKVQGIADYLANGSGGYCQKTGTDSTVCDCIVVRGLEWQEDTLPARPVESTKILGGTGSSRPVGEVGGGADYSLAK